MVEKIKRWIAKRRLGPGDKLPKEDDLQALFGVSPMSLNRRVEHREHGPCGRRPYWRGAAFRARF